MHLKSLAPLGCLRHLPQHIYLQTVPTLLAGFLLVACGKTESPGTATVTPSPASSAQVYAVGTDAAYAPFESQNEKGEIVGFDVEVMTAIAEKTGLKVKFINTPWEGIFNALAQGERDILVSAITITPERQQTLDFSAPYFNAQQLIAVPKTSTVKRMDDLKALKVGVQTGTTGDETVTKMLGQNNPSIKRFESTPLALKELESGGLDAVVADNGVIIHYVANHPDTPFKAVDDTQSFPPEQYGIAVKKGNAALLEKINSGLAAIKADGSYDKIYTKHFGALPSTATSLPGMTGFTGN